MSYNGLQVVSNFGICVIGGFGVVVVRSLGLLVFVVLEVYVLGFGWVAAGLVTARYYSAL